MGDFVTNRTTFFNAGYAARATDPACFS